MHEAIGKQETVKVLRELVATIEYFQRVQTLNGYAAGARQSLDRAIERAKIEISEAYRRQP